MPSTPSTLSDEEMKCLRLYLHPSREKGWKYWVGWMVLALLPLGLFALGQLCLRWLPGYMETKGLAVCQSHATLHHGVVWWPTAQGLKEVCRAMSAVLTLIAFFMAVLTWGMFYHERQAKVLAHVIVRTFPDLSVQSPAAKLATPELSSTDCAKSPSHGSRMT